MAATFRTRPLLLAVSRPAFSPSVAAARGLLANMEQTRRASARRRLDPRVRGSAMEVKRGQSKQEATSSLLGGMMDENEAMNSSEMAILAPSTFVPLPLNKAPTAWRDFLGYYWHWLKQRVTDRGQLMFQAFQLKKKWYKRADFKASRKGIVEAGLKLHAAMSQDLARGGNFEKRHLTEFCVPKLARSLVAAIESRPKGRTYEWERVALTGRPLWPRVVDHKWTDLDFGFKMSFRQAVVGIKSKQRLTELDGMGKVVGTKEMELVEYVVLWCKVDKEKREFGDWQLYGTLKETTWKEVQEETDLLKTMTDMRAEKSLSERRKKI